MANLDLQHVGEASIAAAEGRIASAWAPAAAFHPVSAGECRGANLRLPRPAKNNRAMRQRRARGNLFALDLHTPASSLRMRAVLRRAIETTDVPDRRRWP
jgi:hypothetical protein